MDFKGHSSSGAYVESLYGHDALSTSYRGKNNSFNLERILLKIQVAKKKVKKAFENADSSLRVELIPLKIKYAIKVVVHNSQTSAQQDALILSVIEQLKTQVINYTKINLDNKTVNDTLTAELERYKEQVKVLKEGQNVEKAQQLEPKLYDGNVIKNTSAIVIPDFEETLMLAEESRSKMILKQQDLMVLEKKVNTTPVDYAVLNQLSQDFEKLFVPQTKLSAEQAFWSQNSMNSLDPNLSRRPTKVEVPKSARDKIIPFVKELKDIFNTFDQYLIDELTEVQNVFHQMEQAVEHHRLESKTFEVKMNQVLNENKRLLKQVINKDIVNIVVNSSVENAYVNLHECEECLKLETELLNKKDFIEKETYDKLFRKKSLETNRKGVHQYWIHLETYWLDLHYSRKCVPFTRITTTTKVPSRNPISLETDTPKHVVTLAYLRKPRKSKTTDPVSKSKVVQIVLWYLDSGCSKHMTRDRSQLTNFVNKFLGTVKFRNDHVEKIIGYEDYQIGNVTILRVYYVEGLGHNLFFVGQFCDSNLEVAFHQHTYYIHNLDGVNLLTRSRGNNLYTLSLGDVMASSPICLLSKALKTKSWLSHRRLSHLNFGTINHLARHDLI
uniref:Integrase, catalytic region, zinc finger, CCHC-type, peptidase aspartic, catalytic n=1 Tax=Tanacetum cinerariifolium TaxID=118510 RepID=A0A699HMF7_TANCI|nr:integrase, catalytic region, zinc finger, CCHC-type, peptidase aspartic, catalytic [Tanacetum cinerariifolium]